MSELNFENLLDDRLFTTAELLGFLDKETVTASGDRVYDSSVPASFDTSWFTHPEEQLKAMFGGNKREALQKFVTDLLGSSNSWLEGGGPTGESNETWHSIPKPDKSPSGLYLVLNHSGDNLIIGLGGVYQATVGSGDERVDISLSGSVPVAKVDADGEWSMVLGETNPPSCFSLRLQSVTGNLLRDNPLISLGGISLKLTLGATLELDLLLEQLKLPGEDVPSNRTLAELGQSFNLSFVLNMFLDGLTDDIANPLQHLLGMGGDFPALDWDRLATGDITCLRDWFNELCFGATPKIKSWLAEFAQLLGLGTLVVEGEGTREDPWYVPLSMDDREFLSKLHLTLAVEADGQPTAYPGMRVVFEPFALSPMLLHGSARSELVAINLNNGSIDLLPSLSLDLKLTGEAKADGSGYLDLIPADAGASISLSSPPVSLSAELGFVSAGFIFAKSQGISAYLQLHDVDINGRCFDVMDLNSMEAGLDSALDDAREMMVEALRNAIGIQPEVPSFASRIGALIGLNAPLSAPDWQVDLAVDGDYLTAFLNDPLQAVAWYHSRAVDATMEIDGVDGRSAYHYLMLDLYVLLNGGGKLDGYGTKEKPWLLALGEAEPIVTLTMVADSTPDVPCLYIDLQAHMHRVLDQERGFAVSADVQVRVVDILLPDVDKGLSPARCTWLNHSQLALGFGDLPSLTMGSVTIDATSLTGSIGWSRVDGLVYDLALHGLKLTYQGGEATTPFSWGTLSLPSFGLSGNDLGWLPDGDISSFGPILLRLYGQWLASTSPKGFALAGLLGLLPDLGKFQLADVDYPTWDSSPWALPEGWPSLQFDDWNDLFDNPWDGIKRHLALIFSKPEWALPGLRWLGGFCCDCLPDLSMPDLNWDLGRNENGEFRGKRFPTLEELPFTITGHGTYEDPWKLKVKQTVSAEWHKGAVLIWLDPDGPPVMDVSSMAAMAAPHLTGTALDTADAILTAFDLDGMVDLAGQIGMANHQVARHCKGFDTRITEKLRALETWLGERDGFCRLPLVSGENLTNDRLQCVTSFADLAVASLDRQLDHFGSELSDFINGIGDDGVPLRLVLVGDEHTSAEQWDTLLLGKMGLAPDAIGLHDFCQFGVAPDQQALGLDPACRATIVKLTSLNTAPDQFGWLPMDRVQDNSPAKQLQRVLDHVQGDDDAKIIVISHASAGLATRVVLDAMPDPATRIAGVCAVGMPGVAEDQEQPFGLDPAGIPGVVPEDVLLAVDFLKGLLSAGQVEMHSALSRGVELLTDWYGSGNSYGYDGSVFPEQLPPRGALLFAGIPALPDRFSGVVCKGFYSRLLATAEDAAADVNIKSFLMDWLTAQLTAIAADGAEPTHVGFGLSWEDDYSFGAGQEFFMHSQTRFDLLRVGLAGHTGEEGLQPLPRTRFALDIHRLDGWLVGARNRDIRCRWMEFGLDISPGSCVPDVVFHDAGVNGGQLQRLMLKNVSDVLWTAENEIRVLLQKLCDELPAPHVCQPLSCFMTGSGLFYEEDGRLLPHVNSWQAVLIDPKDYFTTLVQTGLSDPSSPQAQGFTCIVGDVFSLDEAPFIRQLLTIMTSCGADPEARICLLIMQALDLFEHTEEGCYPLVLNWLRLVQNPKRYLQGKWADFTANTPDAQAKRAVLVAEIAVEIQNLSGGEGSSPKWLHDLAFDGNQVSFYLGGDGFEFLNHGVRLRIPVVIDFINGYVQLRFELDASGVIGLTLPSGSATVCGGINVFFDLLVQTNPDQARLLYGLDFGGGAVFDLAESSQWQQVLRRLLTQGLCTQFLAKVKEQFNDPDLQRFIGCFADKGIPASLNDAKTYFDAGCVRCLLNSTGDMFEIRTYLNGVAQNSWDLGDFLFAYPVRPNPDDLELQLTTGAGGLELYENDRDKVELQALLGLIFPAQGVVSVTADCQLVTSYTGIDVDFFCHYASTGGTVCTLTAQGVQIGLYPFTGLADILGSMDALLEQCLRPLFKYLQGADQNQVRFKVCELARLCCTELETLRDDPLDWLVARLVQADIRTKLNGLFSASGLSLTSAGVLEYLHSLDDEGVPAGDHPHILQLRLGPGVGALGAGCGFAFVFYPQPIENIALEIEAACWCDSDQQFQVSSTAQIGLAPNVLVAGGVSIEPTVHLGFDSSAAGESTSLQLIIPNPDGEPFVSLSLLPSFQFALNGSVKQLIVPLLNGILANDQVQEWLDDGEYAIGQILIAMKLLRQETSTYSVELDFDIDWQSSRAVLERIISSALDLLGERRLVEFGNNEGGLYLCNDGEWYGLRVVHSGIRVFDDPEIDLVLGRDTDWITGKGCGLAGGSTDVQAPGLSIFLLKKEGTALHLGCRFVLSDVGLFFQGKGEQALFDVKGCTLKGLGLRGYVDLNLLDSDSVKWALGCECKDFALPISNAAGQGNPVAGSLLASSSEDTEAINPAFDIACAYGDRFSAFIGDKDSKDGVAWMDISKQFGPVYIQTLGIKLVGKKLSILIDGKVEMMGLTVAVDDLSLTLSLDEPFKVSTWELDCQGLGVSYVSGALVVSGALLKKEDATGIEYCGVCTIETGGTTFSAFGAYKQMGSDPSLFVFVVLNTAIGGPPMFFVRGFAGGFGYNRDFLAPTINDVSDFSLVQLATGESNRDPLALLADDSFPPTRGAYWFAAGVKFTTFELFKSFGLLYVLLNRGLEIGLLGRTELEFPEEKPLVHVVMNFKARFSTEDGCMEARAQLTNDSWLFDPNCKLQGGFALASWFAGNQKGDFVITLGGYHADYVKPDHYPDVPRIGFNWQVSSSVSIKGSSYFALTSNAVMAGGELDASYKSGALKAWFKVWANLLIQWKPFFYSFDVGVTIGASYRMSVRIPFVGRVSKTFKVELGGELKIWGPDFAGVATLDWCIISVSVPFGANNGKPNLPPLTWDEFCLEFLPSEGGSEKYLNLHPEKGLIEDQNGKWLLKSECTLRTETVFPTTSTTIGGLTAISHGKKIDLKPMHLALVQSTHIFSITDKDGNALFTVGRWKQPKSSEPVYVRYVDDEETVARMAISFDTQEVAKALWEFDVDADPLVPGTSLKGDMGMSIRFYIDNDTVLNNANIVTLDQNDTSDCVMPILFTTQWASLIPSCLQDNWLDMLSLDGPGTQAMVGAIYSGEWVSRRQAAVAEMRGLGAALMDENDLVGSRLHHLAQRRAMPVVSTLYEGFSDAESAENVILFEGQNDEDDVTLNWSLSVVSLPLRYGDGVAALVTHIKTITGAKSLPVVRLDRFIEAKATSGGRILKTGQSRYGGRVTGDHTGRVLTPRGRAGGSAQRALQEQLYNGLNSGKQGAVLKAGMVHIWKTNEEVGPGGSVTVDGSQATRVCCFDRGGGLLLDQESVGKLQKMSLPEDTRVVTITGLGQSPLSEKTRGSGGVSLHSNVDQHALCGWSSGDMLPQINGNTLLCRGAVLQSSDNFMFQREPSLVNAAVFLKHRSQCTTLLPASVQTVAVLVARSEKFAGLDADLNISFPDTCTVTTGQTISYGSSLLCLYGVQFEEGTGDVEHLAVTVKGRNGWMLAGVCGGVQSLDFWQTSMDLSAPPKVSQDICDGPSSDVYINQDGLTRRLEAYQKKIEKQAEKRKNYADIWKRKTA